jgi:tetratricopeptide (TPR) repeat protein
MSKLPYLGLRPFQREESNLFFGRRDHTDNLLAQLAQQYFLTVVGCSGSGKTSLIQAGLIPRLLEGTLIKPGANWQIAEMIPGTQPFANLTAALQAEQALGDSIRSPSFNEDTLMRSTASLHELLAKYPLPRNGKLLIICDQFEDVFRHQNAETAHFIELLLASSKMHTLASGGLSSPIYVITLLRSDYLDRCGLFPNLATKMNSGLYYMPSLNREQLKAAIEKPAAMFGGEVEPELVTQLLADADHNLDQLPLLQHTLLSLWTHSNDKKLTIFDYFALGGLNQALSNHADQIYQSLTIEQQRITAILFKRLIEPTSKQHYLASPVKLSAVAALSNVHWQSVAAVVEAFRKEGQGVLLPAPPTLLSADTLLDLAYDSLTHQWERLRVWIEEEAKSAENYIRLADCARNYKNNSATLLHAPELDLLGQWYEETEPTAAWAKRYDGDFDAAIAFLRKSQKMAVFKKIDFLAGSIAFVAFAAFIYNILFSSEDQNTSPSNARMQVTQSETKLIKPDTAKPRAEIPAPLNDSKAKPTIAKNAADAKKTPNLSSAKAVKPELVQATLSSSADQKTSAFNPQAALIETKPIEPKTAKPATSPVNAPKTTPATAKTARNAIAETSNLSPTEAAKPAVAQTTIDKNTLTDLTKRFPDKMQLMQEYKKLGLSDPALWHKLADQLKRQSELEPLPQKRAENGNAAIQAYQKAVDLNDHNYKAWFSLGDIYRVRAEATNDPALKENNRNNAIAAYRKVAALYPDSKWVFYYLGALYQEQKKFDEAIESYKKQLDITPDHKFAWHYLGSAYQKQNKFSEAIAAYQQDLKLNPNNADAKKQLQFLLK